MTARRSDRDRSTPDGRAAREARAAAQRQAAARAQQRRTRALWVAVVAVVAVAVVAVGAVVQSRRAATPGSDAAPAGTTGAQRAVFAVGSATAPVPVDLYEDFQCPACAQLETALGPTLKELVDQGQIVLRYRPVAILDRFSSTRYSTRALNAAGCVIDQQPAAFTAFHDLLFANQPPENTPGLDDSELVDLAQQAEAGDISECVRERPFEGWAARVTDQSSKDGVVGTPTLVVAGRTLRTPAELSPDGVRAAVRAAATATSTDTSTDTSTASPATTATTAPANG